MVVELFVKSNNETGSHTFLLLKNTNACKNLLDFLRALVLLFRE